MWLKLNSSFVQLLLPISMLGLISQHDILCRRTNHIMISIKILNNIKYNFFIVIALQVDTYTSQALTTLDTCGQYQTSQICEQHSYLKGKLYVFKNRVWQDEKFGQTWHSVSLIYLHRHKLWQKFIETKWRCTIITPTKTKSGSKIISCNSSLVMKILMKTTKASIGSELTVRKIGEDN